LRHKKINASRISRSHVLPVIGSIFHYLYGEMRFSANTPILLSRTACFGSDVILQTALKTKVYNVQKARLDLLSEKQIPKVISIKNLFALFGLVRRNITNLEIVQLLCRQQMLRFWSFRNVKAIILDTYSDLTDQEFIDNQNCRFFLHHSDVISDRLQDGNLQAHGLIHPEKFAYSLDLFMKIVEERFGTVPVIFIVFPTLKEKREKFIKQNEAIVEILNRAREKYSNLKIISLGSEYQLTSEDLKDPYVYHYGRECKGIVSKQLRKLAATFD
jgi:hypothetical protein